MNEYTASNGVKVHVLKDGIGFTPKGQSLPSRHGIDQEKVDALWEFFRAEEDELLGRWRWPKNPGYVVYPREERGRSGRRRVVVLDETMGSAMEVVEAYGLEKYSIHLAARAYFDAHPEPKPWHDAKEGEAWVITVNGEQYPAIFQAGRFRDHGGAWTNDVITAARRIYPEEVGT